MLKHTLRSAYYDWLSKKKAVNKIIEDLKNKKIEFKSLPEKYIDNPIIAESAIYTDSSNIQYISKALKENEKLVKIALYDNPENINFLDSKFKTDKQLAQMILPTHSGLFKYFSPELRSDIDIVVPAISANTENILYANPKLIESEEFLLKIIKDIPSYIQNIPDHILNNKGFILKALKINYKCLHFLDEHLQQDEEIMLTTIQQNASTYGKRYITGKLDTIQFAIKAIFANKDVLPNLSLTKTIHPQIKWLKRNIDNMHPEHMNYIKDTFLKYPNAFVYPDDMVKALTLGTPDDYLIMAHYAISKHDKTKNTQPEIDKDFTFIPN